MRPLTDREVWRLRGLIDAHGEDGAAQLCGVTVREMCDAIYWLGVPSDVHAYRPVVTQETLMKIRRKLPAERQA